MDTRLVRRRRMRREPTDAEAARWKLLRSRGLGRFKFRRQYPAGPFILEFFCPARRLAIELLRFPNDVIFREPDSVVAAIAGALGFEVPSLGV